MKTINENPQAFFEETLGWQFLSPEGGSGSDSETEESVFELSGASDQAASESESDASDLSGVSESDADSDASGGASGSASGSGSEDEKGEDWDELEKKAARVLIT
jgi:nucleosome binding factor SPN SPT16 subunit